MQKPRILVLLPFLVKGALSIKILRCMRERGFDITVLCRADASHIYQTDALEDFQTDGCLIDLSNLAQSQCLPMLIDEVDKRRINLIIQIGAYDLYRHLPYLKEKHSDIRIVDVLYNEYGHTLNHFLYEACFDGVIVESEAMQKFLQRATAKSEPNVKILYSGIDVSLFSPESRRVHSNDLVIGYVGRMSDEKNPLGFVDLAEWLHEKLPDVKYRMFGTGDQEIIIKERISHGSNQNNIIFEGYIENISDALAKIDILVLPSKFDGRPNIIMEANACGIPVIAAPVGGVPEMIVDGVNGYLIGPQNRSSIFELISAWEKYPESLYSLKKSSREFAASRFCDKRMFDDYCSAFIEFASYQH